MSDIARVDTRWRHPSASWVSKSAAIGQPGNGASRDPAITRPGSPVFYESEATNLQPRRSSGAGFSDRNGVQDIFFWNVVSRNASLQSRDSDNAILNLPQAYSAARPPALSAPSKNPAASYYGNYLLFETAHPLVDLPVASKAFPGLERRPGEAARLARSDAALNQVYLRYIGPR